MKLSEHRSMLRKAASSVWPIVGVAFVLDIFAGVGCAPERSSPYTPPDVVQRAGESGLRALVFPSLPRSIGICPTNVLALTEPLRQCTASRMLIPSHGRGLLRGAPPSATDPGKRSCR